MPILTTPHTSLYYDITAADVTEPVCHPTVLLLHGFAGTPESDFEAQIPLLSQQYNVLAPHFHGYGLSSHREIYRRSYYREDVADIVALLNQLQLGSVKVLGFSDGGIVGLLLAALHPQRVSALAVLGAQASLQEQDVAGLRRWLLEKPLDEEWQQELALLHGEPYWRTLPALYIQGQEAILAAGGEIISQQELKAIRCPTLIMHGSRDRVVAPAYAYELAEQIPHAQLVIFDAGHPAHLRCEEAFMQTIQQFFAKN